MNKRIIMLILILTIIVIITIPTVSNANTSDKNEENFANVVFFAYFKGDIEGKEYLVNNFDNFKEMYDGSGELSVKGYLNKVSYGKFNLINIFPQYNGKTLVPIELPCTSEGLENTNEDYTIIQSIISAIPNSQELLDYNNDGYIDNFSIILKGGSENASSNSTLVSHKSDYAGNEKWSNKQLGSYNMLNTYTIGTNKAGVITHEFMHSLGYPDLYNYDETYPVYTWDIMGAVNEKMSYPLAYLRMKFSNWLTIDTITSSTTLTLDTQYNVNGNKAYILKSPLNEYELFVVEFRKKAKDLNHIDRLMYDSGIIVYRVNTKVEGLSNNRGETGVYVFRDESANSSPRVSAYMASFSKEQGKTTIGNKDLSITKGALTFSDGSNSGIVISNISSNSGEQMTLDVYIPEQEKYDTWKEINFTDEIGNNTNKKASILSYNNKIYSVSIGNNKIYTKTYDTKWHTVSINEFADTSNITNIDLIEVKGNLYLLESQYEKIAVYQFYDNNWKEITKLSDTNGVSGYKKYNDELYLTNIDKSGKNIEIFKLENDIWKSIKKYNCNNEFVGDPKIEIVNDILYSINRTADGTIKMYQLKDGMFSEIKTTMNSNQYDVISKDNKIYFILGCDYNKNKMRVVIFDGKNFETVNTNVELGFPQVTIAQGDIYILAMDQKASGQTSIYIYDEKDKTLKQVGLNVDNGADFNNISFTSLDNKIYVMLKKITDGAFIVKEKELETKKDNKTLEQYLIEAGYKVEGEYVRGFNLNESIIEIRAKLNNSEINIQHNKDVISTGVKFSYKGEEITGIVCGDIDGDGRINSLDLLKMRQHLIKKIELTGANKKAASIANNAQINSLDLLKLRRHLIKIEIIKQ